MTKHSCLPPQGKLTIHAENKISSMHPRKVLVRRIWPCLHVFSFHSQCQIRCADCPPLGYNRTSWAWSQPLLVYTIKQSVDIPADMKCRRLGTHGMPALGEWTASVEGEVLSSIKETQQMGHQGVMRDSSAEIILRSWETVHQKSSSSHERRFSRNHPPVMTDCSAEILLHVFCKPLWRVPP